MQKKLNVIKSKFLFDQKHGIKHCAVDFQQIHVYRHLLNQKIYEEVKKGSFHKVKTLEELGNLMEVEEKELFHINISKKPRGASGDQNSK